jgi:hypothetical protein
VQHLFERVIEKNAERNYYVPELVPVETAMAGV